MWGIYPALVPMDGGQVEGVVWKVETEEEFQRLVDYETEACSWCYCIARWESGEVLEDCRTFSWAGATDSRELVEGRFDFERCRRYFKPSVVRKGNADDSNMTKS